MTGVAFSELRAQGHALDTSSQAFGELRRTDAARQDAPELRRRLDEDGYLYLPELLDRDEVLAARRDIMTRLADQGHVAPGTDPMAGVPGPRVARRVLNDVATASEPLQALLYAGRTAAFYQAFFGEPVRHFDYTWLRAIPPGNGTAPHGDSVFMSRGTPTLMTAWVPLGDVDLRLGGLMMLEGSHRLDEFRRDYHSRDVDAYCANHEQDAALVRAGRGTWDGVVDADPARLRERFGLRWLTGEFRAGDVVTFPMYTLHASLDNTSDRLRLSCDIRYQPASQPADPRWVGANPSAHGAGSKRGLIC